MLKQVINAFENQLQEYLHKKLAYPSGITLVSAVGKDPDPNEMNKIIISLLSTERETAGGIAPVRDNQSTDMAQGNPPIYMNLNIILAAVFDRSKYGEALSILSKVILFIQSHSSIQCGKSVYTLEIVSPNLQELNNIWSIMGGQYYPSVICKLRRIAFDSGEIRNQKQSIESVEINVES